MFKLVLMQEDGDVTEVLAQFIVDNAQICREMHPEFHEADGEEFYTCGQCGASFMPGNNYCVVCGSKAVEE